MFTDRDRQKCQRLYERYYAGRKFYDAQYRSRIYEFIRPGMRVLDAGCGRRLPLCRELSGIARMVGLDLEPDIVADNRDYPFGIRGDVTALPFAPASFDMIVSRSVIEHLPVPVAAFREFARVLKPRGILIIVTPNKYDYVSFVAHFTPHRFHQRLCSRIFNVSEDDVFPTFYRANTTSAIRKIMSAAGLVEKSMTSIAHYPAYLSFSPVLFRLGVLYERLTSTRYLSGLRGSILCVFEKPAHQAKPRSLDVRNGAKAGVS
jgi:SAM-dependent methyltransferase